MEGAEDLNLPMTGRAVLSAVVPGQSRARR